MTNALAYLRLPLATKKKTFMTLTPGLRGDKTRENIFRSWKPPGQKTPTCRSPSEESGTRSGRASSKINRRDPSLRRPVAEVATPDSVAATTVAVRSAFGRRKEGSEICSVFEAARCSGDGVIKTVFHRRRCKTVIFGQAQTIWC
jgi:hypothetical protein